MSRKKPGSVRGRQGQGPGKPVLMGLEKKKADKQAWQIWASRPTWPGRPGPIRKELTARTARLQARLRNGGKGLLRANVGKPRIMYAGGLCQMHDGWAGYSNDSTVCTMGLRVCTMEQGMSQATSGSAECKAQQGRSMSGSAHSTAVQQGQSKRAPGRQRQSKCGGTASQCKGAINAAASTAIRRRQICGGGGVKLGMSVDGGGYGAPACGRRRQHARAGVRAGKVSARAGAMSGMSMSRGYECRLCMTANVTAGNKCGAARAAATARRRLRMQAQCAARGAKRRRRTAPRAR